MGGAWEIYLQHSKFIGRLCIPDCLFGKGNPDWFKAPIQAPWLYHLPAALEKLMDFQAAEVSAGTPAWCTIYHDTDVFCVREGTCWESSHNCTKV